MAAKVGSDYYPEIMGNLFIVNAPMLFSGIWAVVKGFLDEKTRGKIKIIGTNFLPTLEQFMDREQIPDFLGGGSPCSGEVLLASHGPWDDFEIHGTGIRRKGAATTEEVKTDEPAQQEAIVDGAAQQQAEPQGPPQAQPAPAE